MKRCSLSFAYIDNFKLKDFTLNLKCKIYRGVYVGSFPSNYTIQRFLNHVHDCLPDFSNFVLKVGMHVCVSLMVLITNNVC